MENELILLFKGSNSYFFPMKIIIKWRDKQEIVETGIIYKNREIAFSDVHVENVAIINA